MKKIFVILLTSTILFTACSTSSEKELEDGIYYALGEVENNGWMPYVEFTVEKGKITEFDFDSYNMQTGDNLTKSDKSEAGEYNLSTPNAGELHEQYARIEQYVLDGNDITKVKFDSSGKSDAISGATISFASVKALYEKAVEAGPVKQNDTSKDGYYFGQASVDEHGSVPQIVYIVYNGAIVGAHVDDMIMTETGEVAYKSTLSVEGEYDLSEDAISPLHEQFVAISDYFVENQGFESDTSVDAISGATISIGGYVEAFEAAKIVK